MAARTIVSVNGGLLCFYSDFKFKLTFGHDLPGHALGVCWCGRRRAGVRGATPITFTISGVAAGVRSTALLAFKRLDRPEAAALLDGPEAATSSVG